VAARREKLKELSSAILGRIKGDVGDCRGKAVTSNRSECKNNPAAI
jgi:hypothetical protein